MTFKVNYLCQKLSESFSFFFILEYQFRSTFFFVIDFDDEDYGEYKQASESALAHAAFEDETVGVGRDAFEFKMT